MAVHGVRWHRRAPPLPRGWNLEISCGLSSQSTRVGSAKLTLCADGPALAAAQPAAEGIVMTRDSVDRMGAPDGGKSVVAAVPALTPLIHPSAS